MTKPTTGKYSQKRYQCTDCGYISLIGTNHWGECYPRCRNCGWKHPMQLGQVHICLEPVPDGYDTPTPWKMVRLGDVAEIVQPP
jgi:hypothetical protein